MTVELIAVYCTEGHATRRANVAMFRRRRRVGADADYWSVESITRFGPGEQDLVVGGGELVDAEQLVEEMFRGGEAAERKAALECPLCGLRWQRRMAVVAPILDRIADAGSVAEVELLHLIRLDQALS